MGIDIGVHTGPQEISMQDLKRIWKRADDSGFRWISVWDHFYANPLKDRNDPCFEGVASMAALAALTKRVQVGCLMFCALYRAPALLAKAAVTIDHISNGRANLGVGAGWFKEEFEEYGFRFPPIGERFEHMEEALQIIRGMFEQDSVTFKGRYYQVTNAVCSPKPVQKRLPIWVGGRGPERTPATAARYADGFNVPYIAPEDYKKRQEVVDQTCDKIKRDPRSIRRTVNLGFYMGADAKSAEKNRERTKRFTAEQQGGLLVGTVQEVADKMEKYVQAGAQGINIAIRPPVDWDAFEAFIEQIMPKYHG
jgi:F420-dependent oxidoreductase-like protein